MRVHPFGQFARGARETFPGLSLALGCLLLIATFNRECVAQAAPGLLVTRANLTAAAEQAEFGAAYGPSAARTKNALLAAAIRQRLRDGDFQVGDRVVVTIISDAVHRDTLVVHSGRSLEVPGGITVPVAGVLRSELQQRVSSEVLKYVKASQIEVTPLMRIGIFGAVARPGYFAFASDIPLTDAIMGAGGPTMSADLDRSIVRRFNHQYRSAGETRSAIAGGVTLDQFGLIGGDEIVIGNRRDLSAGTLIGMSGGLASVLLLFVTLRR